MGRTFCMRMAEREATTGVARRAPERVERVKEAGVREGRSAMVETKAMLEEMEIGG